jgi:hypothetical protein
MDGRVVYELLNEKTPDKAPVKVQMETLQSTVSAQWGSYKLILQRSILGKYIYVDFAKAIRILK